MVPLQLMSISGKELHVSVLPLHVPERPFLGGRHPDGLRGLGRGLRRGRGLRGRLCRLGRWTRSLWRLRGAREPVLGRPLRPAPSSEAWPCFCSRVADLFAWGLGAGVGGSAGAEGSARGFAGTVAGAGSGSGSAKGSGFSGSAGSAAAGSGSEATGGSALSAISFKDYFIGRSPRKSQRKRWSRGYLRRCRLHLSI